MYTPTEVHVTRVFYPFGDTPAVNFLRDSPAPCDGETSRVLVLACGDPGSILFTLWSNQATIEKQSFSFTCCDMEPAVLARNAVLFTLAADDVPDGVIWSLFYHLHITKEAMKALESQCTKLVQASGTLESWMASKYAKILRWVDKDTLSRLRAYWLRYHRLDDKRSSEIRAVWRRCYEKELMEDQVNAALTARGAAPHWACAMGVMTHVHERYWATGVAGGNKTDREELRPSKNARVNPLFSISATSDRAYEMINRREPLAGFHLAEAFEGQETSKDVLSEGAVRLAKTQFGQWCRSFKRWADADKVKIVMFCGEALAFCHFLQSKQRSDSHDESPRAYKLPFDATPLSLDGNATRDQNGGLLLTNFDVIDSSDLGEQVGLVNLLCATAPLLRQNSNSTLYTEGVRYMDDDDSKGLSSPIGAEVTTFSLLIGLIPVEYMTGTAIHATNNEEAMFSKSRGSGTRPYRQRIPWKSTVGICTTSRNMPQDGIPEITNIEAQSLAKFLYNLYRSMMNHENSLSLAEDWKSLQKGLHLVPPMHVRASVVTLIKFLKTRLHTDWEEMMKSFMHLVEGRYKRDASTLCPDALHELEMHMHLNGVWIKEQLARPAREVAQSLGSVSCSPTEGPGFLARDDLPNISTLVIVVPRAALGFTPMLEKDEAWRPALRMVVSQPAASHPECSFYSCFGFFGRSSYNESTSYARFREDKSGKWNGKSDLVVMCAVPTFILLLGPRQTINVALKFQSHPGTTKMFPRFGTDCHKPIFETNLGDRKWCFVCRDFPNLEYLTSISSCSEAIAGLKITHESTAQVTLVMNAMPQVTHLQKRISYPVESVPSKELSADAVVTVTQASRTALNVRIGTSSQTEWSFPVPIEGSSPEVEIAPDFSWLQISVPLFNAIQKDSYQNWMQMLVTDQHPPYSPYMPRIDLDLLPRVQLENRLSSIWLRPFVGTMFSDEEYDIQKSTDAAKWSAKFALKRTTAILFTFFAGLIRKNKKTKVFLLKFNSKLHTLIFATDLRYDLDLGSIVLDAYVVPTPTERQMTLKSALERLFQDSDSCSINQREEEMKLWKRLLPLVAERCRLSWTHKATCEYTTQKRCPLSVEALDNPLCSCGEGQISGTKFVKLGDGIRNWRPFAKHAIRVAIPLMFPVPYIEPYFRKAWQTLPLPLCDHCGARDTMKFCARCNEAKYCSSECQQLAWKAHKAACGEEEVCYTPPETDEE